MRHCRPEEGGTSQHGPGMEEGLLGNVGAGPRRLESLQEVGSHPPWGIGHASLLRSQMA